MLAEKVQAGLLRQWKNVCPKILCFEPLAQWQIRRHWVRWTTDQLEIYPDADVWCLPVRWVDDGLGIGTKFGA